MNNIKSLLFSILAFSCFYASGQESDSSQIYEFDSSYKFGTYLLNSGQAQLALWEFERLNFYYPGRDSVQLQLFSAYRSAKAYDVAYVNLITMFPGLLSVGKTAESVSDEHQLPTNMAFHKEYIRLSFHTQRHSQLEYFLVQPEIESKLTTDYRINMLVGTRILQKKWVVAKENVLEYPSLHPSLRDIVNSNTSTRKKSKWLAAGMSAVVPGSGKVYAGKWKDGLVSLLFVSANAFSSYRGFEAKGINSFYGWFFGSVGLGFYIGNVYGSYKSAKKANQEKEVELLKRAEDAIYRLY